MNLLEDKFGRKRELQNYLNTVSPTRGLTAPQPTTRPKTQKSYR